MTFTEAITKLKEGKLINKKSWHDKNITLGISENKKNVYLFADRKILKKKFCISDDRDNKVHTIEALERRFSLNEDTDWEVID